MDETRARALIARLPGLTAEQLRPLIAAAGGEPAAVLTRRAADAPDLPPAARAFLASPDETALEADLAWLRLSGARILLSTDPEYPPLLAESSGAPELSARDRKSTRLNSSHGSISYAVFCLKKKNKDVNKDGCDCITGNI